MERVPARRERRERARLWDDAPVFRTKDVTLSHGYLWDVARICMRGDSGTVTPAGCTLEAECHPKVMVGYPVPPSYRRPLF